jgi:hypothetical protein
MPKQIGSSEKFQSTYVGFFSFIPNDQPSASFFSYHYPHNFNHLQLVTTHTT